MSNSYSYPPSDPEKADEWTYDHSHASVAYAAGWIQSGQGYGEQAREEWPACPGFDFDEGLPDWDHGLDVDEGAFEYRTVLYDNGGIPCATKATDDGWELFASFDVNPEPELYAEDGSPTGVMYIGEYARELVYRRPVEDD